MKKVEVVAAIIQYENTILCVQRPEHKLEYVSKKYEFPGGKIEEGESHQQALKREIIEELNMEIEIGSLLITVVHPYPDFELTMHAYECKCTNKKLTLNEHIDCKWLKVEDLEELDWAGADIPITEKLAKDA